MEYLRRISQGIDSLNDRIGRAVGWLTLAMVLIGAFNALARTIGTHLGQQLGSNLWLEAQWYSLPWSSCWGLRRRCGRTSMYEWMFYGRLSERGRAG